MILREQLQAASEAMSMVMVVVRFWFFYSLFERLRLEFEWVSLFLWVNGVRFLAALWFFCLPMQSFQKPVAHRWKVHLSIARVWTRVWAPLMIGLWADRAFGGIKLVDA